MRADIHISDNPGFVYDKRCWASNVVCLQTQPVIDPILFDDLARLVDQ